MPRADDQQPDSDEERIEDGADGGPRLEDPEFAREFVRRCPEALYVTDVTGRFVDGNPAMLELLAVRSRRQLRSLDPEELFVDLEILERRDQLLRRQEVLRNFEIWIRRADGEVALVLDTCWLRRNGNGRVVGAVGMMREAVDSDESSELRVKDSRFLDPDTGAYRQRYLELQRYKLESARLKWGCLRLRLDLSADAGPGETTDDRNGDSGAGGDGARGNGAERRRLLMRQLAEFVRKHVRKEALLFRLEETELVVVATIDASGDERLIARRLARAGEEGSPIPFTVGVAYRRPTETVEKVLERAAEPTYTISAD